MQGSIDGENLAHVDHRIAVQAAGAGGQENIPWPVTRGGVAGDSDHGYRAKPRAIHEIGTYHKDW
jgi:hypothetical protein